MIDFVKVDGTWQGLGHRGRQWLVTQVPTGWRLQFVDPGRTPVNSGTYASADAAMADAGP